MGKTTSTGTCFCIFCTGFSWVPEFLRIRNQQAAGSIPAVGSSKNKGLRVLAQTLLVRPHITLTSWKEIASLAGGVHSISNGWLDKPYIRNTMHT
jgi:hypothetical protein